VKLEMAKADLDNKDQLIQATQKDIDRILTEEAANGGSQSIDTLGAVNAVLAESVRTQRLYFVVRSVIMSLISALIYFVVVLYLGSIDAVQAAFLGVLVFILALLASRLFDKPIVIASKKIIRYLNKHERLRTFILRKL
jgi:ABC-type multidrug transport system fused ATPase/permease subunit